ncbi:MAG TPA: hypothetical protein VHF25_13520, partial [Nitriliruptorales bacterium]|nr:hypothetical protein [Nitriliruptorales bacterium]
MRTLATAVTAAVGLVGCTGGNPAAEGRPPIQQVAIADLPDQPAHNPSRPVHQRLGPVDRSDPQAVALALIIAGLAREGLEVVDVGAQTASTSADQATVRVAAT